MIASPGADATYRYGAFLGQSMFTPQNLFLGNPDKTDRPYAGWLYAGGRLYREDGDTLDRAEATLGVVGPASGADSLQKWWHAIGLFGGVKPQGWSHQLRDEPGLVLTEQHIARYGTTLGGFEVEALPELSVTVGNVFDYAAAGAMVRFGQGLKADWGPARIQPGLDGADFVDDTKIGGFAWYVFAGLEGRAVARNIFLDGNSFESGPRVDRTPGVLDLNAGAAILWPSFRLEAVFTERGSEFRGQRGDDRFLAINLSFAR